MRKKCRFGRRYLLAYFLGEIQGEKAHQMEVHLKTCISCQQDLAILQAILTSGEEMKREIEIEMQRVDWEGLSRAIEGRIQVQEKDYVTREWSWPWFLLRRWPVITSLVIGLILGLMAYHFILRPKAKIVEVRSVYQIPELFLNRVDEEMARREIIDYLEKSRQILLLMKEAAEETSAASVFLPREGVRDLLLRKKYFSAQLDSFRLAKARQILEEIDTLLFELALMEEKATHNEARQLIKMIDERRLLLKIQLLQQELEEI